MGIKEAKIMSTVGVDSLQSGNSITAGLRCFVDTVSLAVYVMILLVMDWRAFIISLIVVSMMFVITKFIARSTVKAAESSLSTAHTISDFMKNVVRGYRSIKIYGLQAESKELFKGLSTSLFKPHAFSVAVGQYLRNVNEAVQILGLVSVLVVYWVAFGYEGVEILGALALFQRVGASAAQLSGDLNKFQSLVPYLRNFRSGFGIRPENEEESGPLLNSITTRSLDSLRLDSVGFSHSSGRGLVNCSFSVSRGEALLVKGPSGSGKSTLIDCLLGLLDYQSGSIYFNENRVCPEALRLNRKNVALVDQNPYFGGGHIFTMLLGDSPSKVSALISCLESFKMKEAAISIRKHGLGALSEVDFEFSGGEKQRLAIALTVAVAEERRLVIFDEPTAALDAENAAVFRAIVSELKRDRLILIVSHDQEMVSCVDGIVDLTNGNGENL
jgi:ATP-binding cassette subfamily C protein